MHTLDKLRSRFIHYSELLENLEHSLKDIAPSILPQDPTSSLEMIYNDSGTCFKITIGDNRCIKISQIPTSSIPQDTEDSIAFTLDSEIDEGIEQEIKILSIKKGVSNLDIQSTTASESSLYVEDPIIWEEPASIPQPTCKIFKLGTKSDYEDM